jgi:hypothetical protein
VNQSTVISPISEEAPPRDFLLKHFPKWTLAHWCVVMAAASFLILAVLPEGRLNDFDVPTGGENVRVARSLAFHGTFANPFSTMNTGMTAHVAPVYPFLYSLVLRGFGTGYTALLTLWAVNVSFLALQFGLLPLLSLRLHLGVLPGILAAILGAFSLYAPIDTRWESFLAGLLLLLAFLFSERAFRSKHRYEALLAGALWGFVVLTNPVTVLLLAAWPLVLILTQPKPERARAIRLFSVMAGVALLITSVWIGRDYARFRAFIFVRDNLGLELSVSNNDCAAPSIRENIQSGCHARMHPNPNAAVAAQVAASGELAFNRARLHDSFVWIKAHPSAFWGLTIRRLRLFWFPVLDRWWEVFVVWSVTLLSFLGLGFVARKNHSLALLLLCAWILFPLVYYITQFEPRYRYPIYWTSLLPAGYALTEIFRRLLASSRQRAVTSG